MSSDLRFLVVDPASASRNRLKITLLAARRCSSPVFSSTLKEAYQLFDKSASFDVVIIAARLGVDEVVKFAEEMKAKDCGRDTAFILLFDTVLNAAETSEIIFRGADGVLCEPYSVDHVTELVGLADRVRKERRASRFTRVGKLLVHEIIEQFSHLARLTKARRPAAISRAVFQELCGAVRELEPDLREQYLSLLIEGFVARNIASAPGRSLESSAQRSYSGSSERVRRTFAHRALRQLRGAVG